MPKKPLSPPILLANFFKDIKGHREDPSNFPDPQKSEHFKEIIKRLVNPDTYDSMKSAIDSKDTPPALKKFWEGHFQTAYENMLESATKQGNHLAKEYSKRMMDPTKPKEQKSLLSALQIIMGNIKHGKFTDVNKIDLPDDIKPLAEQMEAVFREIAILKSPKSVLEDDLDHHRNRVVAAYKSLTEVANGKKRSDFEIITKDPSPVTTAFKKAYYAVANALSIVPSLLRRNQNSNLSSRHSIFGKSPHPDLKKSVKDVKKDLELTTTPRNPR